MARGSITNVGPESWQAVLGEHMMVASTRAPVDSSGAATLFDPMRSRGAVHPLTGAGDTGVGSGSALGRGRPGVDEGALR